MNNFPFTNRELSWLQFNERVLLEASDAANPLMERMKFLAIFASNLDEFFMIRVAGLKDQVGAGYVEPDLSGYTPESLLQRIGMITRRLNTMQQDLFSRLKKELAADGIVFLDTVTEDAAEMADAIFSDEVEHVVSPVTIDPAHPFPFIFNKRIFLLLEMQREGRTYYSVVLLPEKIRRLYTIRKNGDRVVLPVEEIIRSYIHRKLPTFDIVGTYVCRVIRNADLTVEEEESEDLLTSIEEQLSVRPKGEVVRVEIDREATPEVLQLLTSHFHVDQDDIFNIGGMLDLACLFAMKSDNKAHYFPPLVRATGPEEQFGPEVFDRIKQRSIVLYRPFCDFSVITNLVKVAAADPDVLTIKMTLYRANADSEIIRALIGAAQSGKHVGVVIELKARFDEERNVEWARKLEDAGAIVTYGIPGLKIHAKNLLIVRREMGKIVKYCHLSTGNYNEQTAKIYTDIDIVTADEDTGYDQSALFNYLMGYSEIGKWRRFGVAPKTLRTTIEELLEREMSHARAGKPARLIAKMNSLVDQKLIAKLYEASQAGVEIDLIVRGICCLQAGVKGVSENIRVRSIVGRFLEHPRIMLFRCQGRERIFISTADWMERNMNRRVELLYEVTDDGAKEMLREILELNLKDNQKAWELIGGEFRKVAVKGKKVNSQGVFLEGRRCFI